MSTKRNRGVATRAARRRGPSTEEAIVKAPLGSVPPMAKLALSLQFLAGG